jgi:hypothetical protein
MVVFRMRQEAGLHSDAEKKAVEAALTARSAGRDLSLKTKILPRRAPSSISPGPKADACFRNGS